jgi:hypothetical protein
MFAVGKAHARWCAGRGQDGHRERVQPWAPSPFRTVPHRRKPGPSPFQPDLPVQAACRPVRLDRQETPHPMLGVLVGAAHSRLWMVHRRLLLAEMTPGQGSVAPTREVVAVRARPERPLAPRPGRLADAPPNQAFRDVRPFSAAPESRNSPRHRPTGKSPSLFPRHWSAGARTQGPFSVGRPASTPGVGAPDRARPPLEPDLRATFTFAWTPKYHAAKAFPTKCGTHGLPLRNPPWRARQSRRHQSRSLRYHGLASAQFGTGSNPEHGWPIYPARGQTVIATP